MENRHEISKRALTIKRTLNVSGKMIWQAWSNPADIVQWWAPAGMKTSIIQHEFKVGGHWRYIIPMPDGSEFISAGVYSEIVAPGKIVTSASFQPMTEGVTVHLLFEENGDKTDFTFSVIHPTEEYCKQQEKMGFYKGWHTAFDRLEKVFNVTAG